MTELDDLDVAESRLFDAAAVLSKDPANPARQDALKQAAFWYAAADLTVWYDVYDQLSALSAIEHLRSKGDPVVQLFAARKKKP